MLVHEVFVKEYQNHNINTMIGLLKCIFYMIDRDHSGELDDDELRPVLQRYFKTNDEKEYDTFMNQLDKNRDGKVTFWEFIRIFEVQYV